jgi:mRNA interferase MazF
MNSSAPSRGEIWDVNFDPVIGREQAGARPAVIVSVDLFNEGPADLVVAIPLTRTLRKIRWHVSVSPPEGGLSAQSYIQCENVRSISKARLRRPRGRVSEATLEEIDKRLRILLDL